MPVHTPFEPAMKDSFNLTDWQLLYFVVPSDLFPFLKQNFEDFGF